MYIVGILNNT